MLITIDERRKAALLGTEKETVAYAAEHFAKCANEAIRFHGNFFVALSGGSTPKLIFEKLKGEYTNLIDWKKVFLFWSDERAVPADHPESNYKMAMDAGFKDLPIPPSHIFRMKGEGDITAHASDYQSAIKNTLQERHFDLIMLGVGEDGHTASLFPNTEALSVNDKIVVANFVPQKNCWRMTFTYPLINSAHNIVFYALGKNKEAILKEVLRSNNLPASKVGSILHPALWILDESAGNFLKST